MGFEDFAQHFRFIYTCHVLNGHSKVRVRGKWTGATAGGCAQFSTFENNPKFGLSILHPTEFFISLTLDVPEDVTPFPYALRAWTTSAVSHVRRREPVDAIQSSFPFSTAREQSATVRIEPSTEPLMLVPSSLNPGDEGEFTLTIFWKGKQEHVLLRQWSDPILRAANRFRRAGAPLGANRPGQTRRPGEAAGQARSSAVGPQGPGRFSFGSATQPAGARRMGRPDNQEFAPKAKSSAGGPGRS